MSRFSLLDQSTGRGGWKYERAAVRRAFRANRSVEWTMKSTGFPREVIEEYFNYLRKNPVPNQQQERKTVCYPKSSRMSRGNSSRPLDYWENM